MPVGIEVWDAGGNLIMEYTTRTGRIMGSVTVGVGNQSGSVTDASFGDGQGFYFNAGGSDHQPTVSIAGTTLTWTQSPYGTWAGTIYYGVR